MTKDLTTVSHHIFLVEDDAALSKALRKKLEKKNKKQKKGKTNFSIHLVPLFSDI